LIGLKAIILTGPLTEGVTENAGTNVPPDE
jgi:hypothetical protein